MTRRSVSCGLLAPAMLLLAAHAAAEVTETRTLEETFDLAPTGRVVVDNVFGSIRVTGTDGDVVRMEAVETIEADDDAALERARREVELLIQSDRRLLDLYVDGPFRDRRRRGWARHQRDPGYRVAYDFVIAVPRDAEIEVSTVNDGEISVLGVHGDFDVSNVNGGIELHDLRGSGRVHTVNGPITAHFSRSPRAVSDFKTINGDVEVFFPADLSADLELKSRFGELWSEFDIAPLAVPPAERRTEGDTTVIELGAPMVRVARGGPRLSFETLNGDVLIRRHDER